MKDTPNLASYAALIDGQARPALSGEVLKVDCPSDGLPFAEIPDCGEEDIDAAVGAARSAFEGAWGRFTAVERGRVLTRLSLAIADRAEDLARLEAQDTGKPLSQARADITACARYFEFYGGGADKVHGEVVPYLNGVHAMTLWDPHGVVGAIIPWNYPAQMVGRTCAAALAMGNSIVLKPAEEACLTPIRIAELTLEVGLPAGAFNVVPGKGETAGAALASHPGIDFLTFTGSPEVGASVQSAAAQNHVGCTLELGGKSPQIVFGDADLDAALPFLTKAIVQNGGQTCSAGARVLIERPIYKKVVERLVQAFSALTAGSWEDDCDLGALISARQAARVEGFIERGGGADAPLIVRGKVADDVPSGGHYVAPALFGPVAEDHVLAQQEVFGPVLSLLPFDGEAEACRIANATEYGLVAGVWTQDGGRQMRMAKGLRCGQVFLNCYGAGGGIELPFGGVGKSGHGREKGFAALHEFAQLKTVVHMHGEGA